MTNAVGPTVAVTTTSVGAGALARLRDAGCEVVVNPFGRRPTVAESLELLRDAVGVFAGTGPLTGSMLAELPMLRVISRCGVGVDNVDVDEAHRRGVLVFTTADAVTQAVAELTLGLLLAVLRRIPEADADMRRGAWKPLMGTLLAGKVVGIVGLGRIGARVAELLRPFGVRLLAADPEPRVAEVAERLGADLVALDDLLPVADVVTLHVPFAPSTHHLLGRGKISSMKPGAVLVNASRGGLVDEAALVDALGSRHLGGAGVDTFEDEPYTGPLLHADRVVVTCHMGSYAAETRAAMEDEAVANLLRGLHVAGVIPDAGRLQRPDGGS